jgi:2-polyprenyl-3-methyl-5-hydroxy-6-metoxy-1,4-benzoquinol methylase
MATATWQERFTDYFYPRSTGWVDGTEEFHRLCADVIPNGSTILEIGAGPSNPTSRFLASRGEVHGIDPDPTVTTNDALTTATVMTARVFPFADSSFDYCVSNYVLEHVADPESHLNEVARILRPAGAYVFRTPNRYHYVTLIASLTPHWFHELIANRLRNLSSNTHAPYPTIYALNSVSEVRRCAANAGLNVERISLIEKEPSYGMGSRALFLVFTAYERIVNASDRLANLRANLLVVLRRPVDSGARCAP